MISWRSYTTSKVLPTFVGQSGYSATYSWSGTNPFPEPDGTNQAGVAGSTSYKGVLTRNRLLTSQSWQSANERSFRNSTGGIAVSKAQGALSAATSVTENTTWTRRNEFFEDGTREREPTSASTPLATRRQESTKTESYESGYRTTKTISAYEDDEGNAEPLRGYIWTTTITGAGTDAKTTFEQVETDTTETVVEFKTREGQRTVVTTTGGDVLFKTYTAIDGNVEVIAHTIYELNANTFAAIVDTPDAEVAVTELTFAPTQFTRSFSETYAEELTFVIDRTDRTSTTTATTTAKTDVPTTRAKQTQESWKRWSRKFESKNGCDPEREIYKSTLESFPNNNFGTEVEETITNGTETTISIFGGFATTTTVTQRFNFTALPIDATSTGNTGEAQQRTRTHTSTITFSEEVTTFSVSGNVTKTDTVNAPGFIENQNFPWRSYGEDARRFFSVPGETTLQTTTTASVSPITTMADDLNITESQTFVVFGEGVPVSVGSSTFTLSVNEVLTGSFYRKAGGITTRRNNATAIQAAQPNGGIANQNLNFTTQNTHETAGIFMAHNAEHYWASPAEGSISRGVIGAIPLYPTFSGLITEGSDGWELCDSSEYTTVVGSRVGQNFSTTIAWQTVEGTSTKNSTSSGEFSLNTTLSVSFGVQNVNPTIAGGFATPNASRTLIMSPGVVLMTTYDASGSGTLSSSYSTGTTEAVAPVGPVPVTISSFISRAQGYGVFTQSLLDNGLP
jgi:hypothetical protein